MQVYLKLLGAAIFWGGTFIAGRIVSREMDPYSAAFIRFLIASVFLLGTIRFHQGYLPPLKKNQIIPVVLLGMTGIFSYNILFFKGLHTVHAGRAALIIALNPIFISLCSSIFFKERLTIFRAAGILISFLGAAIVITYGNLGNMINMPISRGDFFIFGCVGSWVAYSLIGKVVMTGISPLVSVGYSSAIGTLALLVPAAMKGVFPQMMSLSLIEWSSLFYLGFFGTVLGFFWYYDGINRIGPMKASVFINFVPVSAILLAYLILDESVTWSLVSGAMLVMSGVLLTNFSEQLWRMVRKQ
ncbi:MAG: EamA family transporter [Deltaproteobacteria bacterium]|jgi:drug/metabolite transporter (DMT)-like permease|nr:EamA family transporter [Deltaproteobacteria bacterium]MBT4087787.1 EamA family transporter [Deltaproteobacteria bacterium]MBT4265880.1 EamA family transporter [Deltaproteobacteria bacterium]MBT4643698.1 EamA family transporter [Deltaproteobacteria bacterium]MBT6502835.1 EamA family transporter [Deltaproteobacteria bacterium]